MWQCKNCGAIIRPKETCSKCEKPTDFPSNISYAALAEEKLNNALVKCQELYYNEATYSEKLQDFTKLLRKSISISINIRPEGFVPLFTGTRYINLHDKIRARALMNYDDDLLAKRKGIDNLAFGSKGEELHYGALNLINSNIGLISYGSVCIFLKNEDIIDRISFLENNSFSYCHGNPPFISFDVTKALRALWDTVDKLAFIKHVKDILSSQQLDEKHIIDIILRSSVDKKNDCFIEAQIFPPISLINFAKIKYDPSVFRPSGKDKVVVEASLISHEITKEALGYETVLSMRLKDLGIKYEVV